MQPANQPPAITSGGGADTAGVELDEGSAGVGTVVASDPEGAPVAYTIVGGADAALFIVDPATGALSFVSAPDYENPVDHNRDNVYEVDLQASDGSLADDTAADGILGDSFRLKYVVTGAYSGSPVLSGRLCVR